ncbi:MAG: threo-3-hydroxy-L-aspartate ammonia-lyase [Elainellaceae cyanobacterium]
MTQLKGTAGDRPLDEHPVHYTDIEAASSHIHGYAHRTPVMTSRTFNERTGCEVFFKCENLQRTGSFKFRGAFNALSQLSFEQRQQGVLTFSSGNHAQAIARAGQILGISTTVIMPDDAPTVKRAATQGYGANVILYDRTKSTREDLAQQLLRERDVTLVPPFDHPHIIAGQGTAAKELLEEVGALDLLLVCCGGGGLLSGSAIAAHALSPGCTIIGVEPEGADDAMKSFYSRTLHRIDAPQTVADGVRTPLGTITFPLILHYVHDMVRVSDAAILQTMFFIWERLKLVVEPTGALAAAALLEGVVKAPGQRVGVVISGGNVDIQTIIHQCASAVE